MEERQRDHIESLVGSERYWDCRATLRYARNDSLVFIVLGNSAIAPFLAMTARVLWFWNRWRSHPLSQ
ncbi:hypothetical protein [Calothrix sp. 336/3]|uniref:hypothetical protein n=1 Tax=Calothrix sp. 336/3 TaxID=1337936 RepID=UPI00118738DD|nr:hypothetical protein [Calothrix sp. 336/3]